MDSITKSPLRNTSSLLKRALAAHEKGKESDKRRSGRMRMGEVLCCRGRVIDLSAGGARLLTSKRWREGETRPVTFTDGRVEVSLRGKCIWKRRCGLFQSLIGVAFEDRTSEEALALSRLALTHASEQQWWDD